MPHVDDGTLHAYRDGELPPAEAHGVETHLAQCPACRERLEEERGLIARAEELLALVAPPDGELPPFRAGDVKPPTRLWWRARLPLAWAATVVLALGFGTYLGRGVEQLPQGQTASDAQPAVRRALKAPASSDRAQRDSRVRERGTAPTPPAASPAAPAPGALAKDRPARLESEQVEQQRRTPAAAFAHAEPDAPVETRIAARQSKGSAISVDSARRVLGTDPLIVPGLPIQAIYRGREIGYSGLVIVEQTLDSSTVIEVVNGRRAPLALNEVVVTGAPAAVRDSPSAGERALMGRARAADSLAAAPRNAAPLRAAGLFVDVRGPLSADSLAALRRLLQPLRP
jgi:putative zinc finger protein